MVTLRKLNERDQDEVECVKHFIRYVNTNPDIEDFEILDAIIRLNTIGNKFINNGYDETEVDDLLDFDDMKDLMRNFFTKARNNLNIEVDENQFL
jgi:hypothetical protein